MKKYNYHADASGVPPLGGGGGSVAVLQSAQYCAVVCFGTRLALALLSSQS